MWTAQEAVEKGAGRGTELGGQAALSLDPDNHGQQIWALHRGPTPWFGLPCCPLRGFSFLTRSRCPSVARLATDNSGDSCGHVRARTSQGQSGRPGWEAGSAAGPWPWPWPWAWAGALAGLQ